MTERGRQNTGNIALISVAISIIGLTITLAVGIWKVGTMWGTVTGEHERIFQMIRDRCK